MEIVLLFAADEDLQAAFDWLDRHREGRGGEFLADVDRELDQLRQFPRMGKVYRGRYRRLLVPSYPYGIFMLWSLTES
jgi:plasmid stabilization system protein ParE